MHALRAKLLAFDMEYRARHEVYAADVLPVEDAEDLGGDAADAERYGIACGDDLLDEVDIGGLDETPCPIFISQYLAPESHQGWTAGAGQAYTGQATTGLAVQG
ncbi:hypothetical protein Droror1_Dr00027419 [Drosera rotundifolia]